MNATNYLSINSEELFSDVASIDVFAKVAEYFGTTCASVFSVYHYGPNRLIGEVELFPLRDVFYFEILEVENILHLIKLESSSMLQ